MSPGIVIDTSVINSGLRSRNGASFRLLELVDAGVFQLCLSVPLVIEYEAVLKRQSRVLGITHADIDDFLDYLCTVADKRQIHFLWRPVLRDPFDDFVLELAVEAQCAAIVTHKLRDFEASKSFGVQILPPGEFLRQLGEVS